MKVCTERFPLDALERLVGPGGLHRLGIDSTQIGRWRRCGLSPAHADNVAVRLGLHPANIWVDWYAAVAS